MCKKCVISGLFNNTKMKKSKSKLNFKGMLAPVIGGAGGAALKMGLNFAINTIDKAGKLNANKKALVSLAVPVLASIVAPKLVASPLAQSVISGHYAITLYELGQSLLPEAIAAKVAGYYPEGIAGYYPEGIAGYYPEGMAGVPNLPFQPDTSMSAVA